MKQFLSLKPPTEALKKFKKQNIFSPTENEAIRKERNRMCKANKARFHVETKIENVYWPSESVDNETCFRL
jgi:hypothetical protein